jgi:heterodisulfide reductase subunit B
MKQYAYYPGCSLESLALSYHMSTLETAQKLGFELREIDDWNCCGATAYFHVDDLLAHTLVARNLALAEKEGLDFVAPCSGCYKNAYFTTSHLQEDPELADHINFALQADNLQFEGKTKVKHLIEVFVDDVGFEGIKEKVSNPLKGLRVAPYYGCQLLRPRKNGEEIENPQFFEGLLSAMGAEPVDYRTKMHCCGGSLIITNRKAALHMVHELLLDAAKRDTDVIATICPMCNVNLEVYQKQVNREYGTNFSIPTMYFTQLLGLALGVEPKRLGIGKELVSMSPSLFNSQK